jgi:hypothetical protein
MSHSQIIKDPLERTVHGLPYTQLLGASRYFHAHVYGRQCIFSVDDDRLNQIVIAAVLKPLGCKLIQAMSGAEALGTLDMLDTLPDLMLLDLMMPGMSGDVVCRHVRARYGVPCSFGRFSCWICAPFDHIVFEKRHSCEQEPEMCESAVKPDATGSYDCWRVVGCCLSPHPRLFRVLPRIDSFADFACHDQEIPELHSHLRCAALRA